jgi:hypothetical protein
MKETTLGLLKEMRDKHEKENIDKYKLEDIIKKNTEYSTGKINQICNAPKPENKYIRYTKSWCKEFAVELYEIFSGCDRSHLRKYDEDD